MTLTKSSTPADLVSLAEARSQLRFWDNSDTSEDPYISALVSAAQESVRRHCSRSFTETTWALKLNCFPPAIKLPMPPAKSVTSITYLDANADTQTLAAANYRLFGAGGYDPFVAPAWNTSWPVTATDEPDAVTVTYVAGESEVPTPVKQAILLLVSHLFEHREAASTDSMVDIPFGVDALLKDYRQRGF